mmetsp:Transcript_15071/g.19878  ORF Transcript_15071/g.19878 Transcript_15071/m.19878 type:complete len:109 (-) Transcript_15071:90-416(-)
MGREGVVPGAGGLRPGGLVLLVAMGAMRFLEEGAEAGLGQRQVVVEQEVLVVLLGVVTEEVWLQGLVLALWGLLGAVGGQVADDQVGAADGAEGHLLGAEETLLVGVA